MGESCCDKVKDHFALRGHRYLIAITIFEILYFLAYTLVYIFNAQSSNDSDNKTISEINIFKWAFVLILLIAIIYFLFHSVSFILK